MTCEKKKSPDFLFCRQRGLILTFICQRPPVFTRALRGGCWAGGSGLCRRHFATHLPHVHHAVAFLHTTASSQTDTRHTPRCADDRPDC